MPATTTTATATERPTKTELLERLSAYQAVYAAMHAEMAIDQDFINWSAVWQSHTADQYLSGFPKGFPIKAYPLAKIGVDNAVNNVITGETAKVTVMLPAGLHKDPAKAKAHAEELESAFQALLWTIDTQSTMSPFRDMLQQGFGLGMGCLSYPIIWERWPDEPKHGRRTKKEKEAWEKFEQERENAFPFDVRSLSPLCVYPDPDSDPPQDYFVEEEISLRSAMKEYPHLRQHLSGQQGMQGYGGSGTVKRRVYCSKDWFAVFIGDEPALTEEDGADADGVMKNVTQRVWYRIAWSGYGVSDHQGRMEYKGRGLVRDARPVIASFVTNRNTIDAVRGIAGFPMMDFAGPTKEQAYEESLDFEYGPAKAWTHSNDVRATPMQPPQVPQFVFQGLQEDKAMLEMLLGPEVLRGVYKDDTASGQSQRLGQAKAPFRAMKKNAEQAVAAMLMDMAFMIKNQLAGPLKLWFKSKDIILDPDQIPNGLMIQVDFSPPTPSEKAELLNEGIQRLKAGGISQRDFIAKYNDGEKPDEVIAEQLAERFMTSEPVAQWAITQILERAEQRKKARQLARGEVPGMTEAGAGAPGGAEAQQQPLPEPPEPPEPQEMPPSMAPAPPPMQLPPPQGIATQGITPEMLGPQVMGQV